jgi:hypothetical protein
MATFGLSNQAAGLMAGDSSKQFVCQCQDVGLAAIVTDEPAILEVVETKMGNARGAATRWNQVPDQRADAPRTNVLHIRGADGRTLLADDSHDATPRKNGVQPVASSLLS